MSIRKSLAWSYGSQAFALVVNFGSSVALARLLSPSQMGVFAFALAVSGVLSVFTQLNLSSYIVREGSIKPDEIRSIFSLNAAMNLALSSLIAGVAVFEQFVLHEPDIASVLFISSLIPALSIFEFVPVALYAREINYAALSKVGIYRTIINVVVVLSCAFVGFGSMSPAIGAAVCGLFTAIVYTVARWRDIVLLPSTTGFGPAFRFGLQMLSINGVAQISIRSSDIILGRLLGMTSLGLYSRSSNIASLIFNNIYGQATGAVFSRMAEDLRVKGSLRDTFHLSLRMITSVMWPIMAGVAILARPIIHILYGERWVAAADPLSLLMVAQFITLGFGMNWELFVLRHETARQTRFEIIRAVVGLIAFTGGCFFSITVAAAGRVVEAIVSYFLYRPHVDRLAGTEKGELERVFGESLLLTAVAVAPSLLLMIVERWAYDTSPLLIAGAVLLGIAGWFAALIVRRHPVIAEVRLVLNRLQTIRGRA